MAEPLRETPRTRLRRLPERAHHDRELAYRILDEALFCHVGFVTGGGPVVIPTIHARIGDRLVVHGSPASRMLRTIDGADVCVTVTLLDGLVLARSVFHHSMNYRSVMIFGAARPITERAQKLTAMRAVTEHVVPGRWDDARGPDEREIKGTLLLEVPLDEASIKVRSGPPSDDEADYDLDVWAGVVPVAAAFGPPEPDPRLRGGVGLPGYLDDYSR